MTNNNGNVMSQTITVPTVGIHTGFTAVQNYTYDSLNRLESATENVDADPTASWKQTFTYDRYGNRNFDEANTTFAGFDKLCNSNSELCADLKKIFNPSINPNNNRLNTSEDYDFDDVGNTTEDPQGRTFIYDAENKQVEVKDHLDNTIGEYFYDGDGKRIKKVVPSTGEVTIFVYDAAGKSIAEYSTTISNDPKVSYTTADHLGSPRILTDENGATISRRDFHPFGEEITTPDRISDLGYQPDDISQKFTSYERDNETELDFAQARMYSSKLGRFSSPDPIFISAKQVVNPQIWNLYSYAANNPLNATDPTGMTIIQLGRDDKDIDKDINDVKTQLKAKGLSKDKKNALNTRKSELELEKKGNAWAREQIKVQEKLGVSGLKVSDFSISTDPKKDFGAGSDFATTNKLTDEQATKIADFASKGGMFVVGDSNQIFINANWASENGIFDMFKPRDPDPDGQIYVASIIEHERFHRNDKVYDNSREKRAYEHQKKLLEKWGPLMQDPARGKAFIQVVDDELTKLKGGK